MGEPQTRGSRVLRSPPIRIVLAALFLLPPVVVVQLVAVEALSIDWRAVAPILVLIALVAYPAYVRAIEKRRPIHEMQTQGMAGQLAAGLVIGAALFATTMLVLWLLGVAEIEPGQGVGALLLAFCGALGAAFWEEILFRAVVFRILSEWLGDLAALAISAALFGLLHAGNPGATVVSSVAIALEAGVLLAAAYMVTRQIWLPIGVHLAWNLTEGGVFGASVSGHDTHGGLLSTHFTGDALLTGGAFGPEASIVAVIVCLIAAALLLAVARRRSRRAAPVGDGQRATS